MLCYAMLVHRGRVLQRGEVPLANLFDAVGDRVAVEVGARRPRERLQREASGQSLVSKLGVRGQEVANSTLAGRTTTHASARPTSSMPSVSSIALPMALAAPTICRVVSTYLA